MLLRWAVSVFQTGLYLPRLCTFPALGFFLSFFLSLFLSFFINTHSCDLVCQQWEALQALARPTTAAIAALRTVVPLSGRQSQTIFPGMALVGSEAAQLISQQHLWIPAGWVNLSSVLLKD